MMNEPATSRSAARSAASSPEEDLINFGDVPEATNALLQKGVLAYRSDRPKADLLFREALAADPGQLPVYYCLYKIYTYQGRLEEALAVAGAGLREAARQAGWSEDYCDWKAMPGSLDGPARFALYTLKAQAFIHLKRSEPHIAQGLLARLAELDPAGAVGWRVIADLARGAA